MTVVSKRLHEIVEASRELDARFDALQTAVNRDPNDLQAQFALADFLVSRQNKLEAIPHLEFVAHNEKTELPLRVRAWVEVCQAHIWIGEREKGRFGAQDLIAKLGPKTADARAGGNLVIGKLEIIMSHPELARQKLQEAVNAAPDSEYGKQAASELTKLSPEKK
jgi:tetratricopeptide (TPR) repeat protein